jgi:nitrile hydratase accessory protein
LTRRDTRRDSGKDEAPPPLPPRREGEPVFAEPWQAQAFALAVQLHDAGHFSWDEWAETLGREIKAAHARGDPDDGSTYYRHWLAALRSILSAKSIASERDVEARKAAWADAFASTPHGEPVELDP